MHYNQLQTVDQTVIPAPDDIDKNDLIGRPDFFDPNQIPVELKEKKQWVLWRLDSGAKVPYQPSGRPARTNDSRTWHHFQDVATAWEQDDKWLGIAFVFSENDPYVGLDLDHCVDAVTGQVTTWARDTIAGLDSYCEFSPSGTGLKVIVKSSKPEGSRSQFKADDHHGELEVYDQRRFFCITGQVLGSGQVRSAPIDNLMQRVATNGKSTGEGRTLSVGLYVPPADPLDYLARLDRASQYLEKVPAFGKGERNNELFTLACRLIELFGLEQPDLRRLIKSHNASCPEPLGDAEVDKLLGSARSTARYDPSLSERPGLPEASWTHEVNRAAFEVEGSTGPQESPEEADAEYLQRWHQLEEAFDKAFAESEADPARQAEQEFRAKLGLTEKQYARVLDHLPPDLGELGGEDLTQCGAAAAEPVRWLVTDLLSADETTIIAGPSKSLKTTLLADLTIALATGTPWLGYWAVPAPMRVLFITGENSRRSAARKLSDASMIDARGNNPLAMLPPGNLLVTEWFPRMSTARHRSLIRQMVEQNEFDVVIVDPLYRGLVDCDQGDPAARGDAILGFAEACLPASLIIAHHFHKGAVRDNRATRKLPDLEDMSGAGVAESCGNWFLLNRVEQYHSGRPHELVILAGSREGSHAAVHLRFHEDQWASEIQTFSEYQEIRQREDRLEQQARELQKKADQARQDGERMVALLEERSTQAISLKKLRELAGMGVPRASMALEYLGDRIAMISPFIDDQGRIEKRGKGIVLTEFEQAARKLIDDKLGKMEQKEL